MKNKKNICFEGCAEHLVGFWDTSLLCSAKKKVKIFDFKRSLCVGFCRDTSLYPLFYVVVIFSFLCEPFILCFLCPMLFVALILAGFSQARDTRDKSCVSLFLGPLKNEEDFNYCFFVALKKTKKI